MYLKSVGIIIIVLSTLALAGEGKTSGKVFYNYNYETGDDAVNGFALRRVYFTFEKELSKGINYKFQTDIDYKTAPKNLYLKNAKVDWSSPIGKLTFGLQGMNVFSVQEKTWGYRFIEKSPMDQYKFSSSADMGIGYSGKFANKIHFSTLYTNGTGYKKSENDSYKKISVLALLGEKKLNKKDGFNVGGVFTYEPYDIDIDSVTMDKKSKTVRGLFGGYASKGIRVGGEFDQFSDAGTEKTKQIISFYGNYYIMNNLEMYLKYNLYDPNTDVDKDGETYLIAGLSFAPGKGLNIAPNIRLVQPEEGDSEIQFFINFLFKF